MKRCSDCQVVKPDSAFFKDNGKRDGLQTHCKACKGKAKKRQQNEKKKKGYKSTAVYYHLIYCPLNSWTDGSSFAKTEIDEMLKMEHLAIGTRFRRNGAEYVVSSYNYGKLRLVRV